ncbi:hypothetical protein MAQ5080_03015 [Marinomonas aquimarina]|uniref:DUF2946 domain-containing protein n=1 Tax=Marinomonas aquimarina TaxID=295068 RepID=A0A1A8TQ50_9GAMM|nr:hypothetical protein [Marinomonas aquimarina]SBS34917.1 hypothetical protein MAQ5080_03015 [Marinomonas aquimarina]
MSTTLAARLRKSGRWVLFAWMLSLLGPLVVPTQPVLQDDYVVLRVCSLMNGVQFVTVPLSEFSDSNVKDHIGQLHASCKCGLNVDHLSIIATDFALSMTNFAPVRWAIPVNGHVMATFAAHYSPRAPPLTLA